MAERQKRLGGWDQQKLEKASVLVAGAGALGNEIVKNLVQLGVRHIDLVDFDYVVPSNLNRCVFFRLSDSEGKLPKAEVVAKRASELNIGVKVVPHIEDLEKLDSRVYESTTVAFGGLDSFAARIQLNIDCFLNGVPLVDGGIEGLQGQVQVVIPPDSPCIECGIGEREKKMIWSRLSCTGQLANVGERKMPALATTTSVIGAIQVQEFLKIIFGIEEYRKSKKWNESFGEPLMGKRLFYSAISNTFRTYEVSRSSSCNVCNAAKLTNA